MPDFIPGLTLAGAYFVEAVQPILQRHFPDLRCGAALIGPGSEVLGFDDPLSTDHDWAPRVQLFLDAEELVARGAAVHAALAEELPFTFRGYPTQLAGHADDPGAKQMVAAARRPLAGHQVQVLNLRDYVLTYTGVDLARGVTLADWLLVPEQLLRSLTAGAVFADELGELAAMRAALAYYPDDLWRYLLAAQWQRIGEEEAFAGRAGSVGDERGSALIAARLVRDIMRLCFLMERRYAPYSKWFGSAFDRLACAPTVGPLLSAVLQAADWRAREAGLAQVYARLAEMHNSLQLTPPMPTSVSPFFSRPFLVMHGGDVAGALAATIADPRVRALPPGLGKIDQIVDNVAVLENAARCRQLAALFPGLALETGA